MKTWLNWLEILNWSFVDIMEAVNIIAFVELLGLSLLLILWNFWLQSLQEDSRKSWLSFPFFLKKKLYWYSFLFIYLFYFERSNLLVKSGGKDTFRFAFFLATFVGGFKAIHCFLKNFRKKEDNWNGLFPSFLLFLKKISNFILKSIYCWISFWNCHAFRWKIKENINCIVYFN